MYHRLFRKKRCIFRPRFHTQLADFEQNLSSLRFSFDTLIGRKNTGDLPALLIKYRKQHSAKNAIISYVQEIKLRRDNLVARSLSALACKHCKIYVRTVRKQLSSKSINKGSMLNEIPKRRDYQNKINAGYFKRSEISRSRLQGNVRFQRVVHAYIKYIVTVKIIVVLVV